nr:MAG TPA: hypothetical protein [Caudoviricetes sp.]
MIFAKFAPTLLRKPGVAPGTMLKPGFAGLLLYRSAYS